MSDLRLGIIGMNEGNGHPFSYSAIFNGYDPDALQRECPFALIKDYLPREHRNENFVEGAKVTHIWTQSREISGAIARVAKIPMIVDRMEEMIGQVDAVILARDDPWNHLEMARPFLEEGVPLFVDKQLAHTVEDCRSLLALAGPNGRLMAGSPARYTRHAVAAREVVAGRTIRSIHGMSRVSWMRYGHHMFEPIADLFGLDIEWVRSLSDVPDHDIVQIRYRNGMNVILEFIPDVHLPIEFSCYSPEAEPHVVPFEDFFHGFSAMLRAFVDFVRTGVEPFPRNEMLGIAQVILAGDLSKKSGGACIQPATLALGA